MRVQNFFVVALIAITTLGFTSCKENSYTEQLEVQIVQESQARKLYASFDEKYKKEKPYSYVLNKYLDIALERMGTWNEDVANLNIEKKQELLLMMASKKSSSLENAKLCSTQEDKFFNDLYFEMINELNSFEAVTNRVQEGIKLSGTAIKKIAPSDMMVSIGGENYSKLDILYRTENKLPFDYEKFNRDKIALTTTYKYPLGPRRVNQYTGFSIWLKETIRYRNYKNLCPNISYMRSAMNEWENAMNNVRKFVEIEDNGWNRFVWGAGTDYHVVVSTGNDPGVSTSSVGAVPWAFVHMSPISSKGDYLHELGHTLGLIHEHQRPDRNDYIIVHTENIESGQQAQFGKIGKAYGPFDFNSIMMYDSYAFSKNGKPTMTKKCDGSKWVEPHTLSAQDIDNIKSIYK